jgi:hypothetical protein
VGDTTLAMDFDWCSPEGTKQLGWCAFPGSFRPVGYLNVPEGENFYCTYRTTHDFGEHGIGTVIVNQECGVPVWGY